MDRDLREKESLPRAFLEFSRIGEIRYMKEQVYHSTKKYQAWHNVNMCDTT